MNDVVRENFRALALAGLGTSGQMLDALAPEAQRGVEGALQSGCRLWLEFGPLPAFAELRLMLIEPEGSRHVLCTLALNTGASSPADGFGARPATVQ